jgi:hypothetical protein
MIFSYYFGTKKTTEKQWLRQLRTSFTHY